eukprot:99802_1
MKLDASKQRVLTIGTATVSAFIYWKWRQRKRKQENDRSSYWMSDLITSIKTQSYLHCYSFIRYYVPLFINNIIVLSILTLYKRNIWTLYIDTCILPSIVTTTKPLKRYYGIVNRSVDTLQIGNLYKSWQFFANDALLILSSLNIFVCIIFDQMFNSDPFHPLMLFERYIEHRFIHRYKQSVNQVVKEFASEFVNKNLNINWLLSVVWEYITYDTRKSHMIIDVQFTNAQLKHHAHSCRKYKSKLSSQFEQYQEDMQFAYGMNEKSSVEIQPNFEYFWKIRSFGFDVNVFTRDYLSTFKLKDSQQIGQFLLWCAVNATPMYAFNHIFETHRTVWWTYTAIVVARESALYAALIRFTSIKWLYSAAFIVPHYLYEYQQSCVVQKSTMKPKTKLPKKTKKQPKPIDDQDWFWKKLD